MQVATPAKQGPLCGDPAIATVELVLAGDEGAWQQLLARVHSTAATAAAKRYPRRGEDFAKNVAMRSIERVRRAEFLTLRRFIETRESYPTLTLDAWLHVLIRNSAVDELRSLPEFSRQHGRNGRVLVSRPHVELEEDHATTGGQSSFHRNLDARRAMQWICDSEFDDTQRQAMILWLDGYSGAEISKTMSLQRDDVTRLLRAARQRLRRRFEVSP